MSLVNTVKKTYAQKFGKAEIVPPDPDDINANSKVSPEEESDIISKYESFSTAAKNTCKDIHVDYLDDKRFAELDEQWDLDAKTRRASETTPRPTLVFNMVRKFINQIVNPIRKNKPAIKVLPRGDGATLELAEFRQSLIAGIERVSLAQEAYLHAFQDAVTAGLGCFRIVPQFESDDSMDQMLTIKAVEDASNVSWDPDSKEVDFSDANYFKIEEKMSDEKFKELYGEYNDGNFKRRFDYSKQNDNVSSAWGTPGQPKVIEFWYAEFTPERLYQLKSLDENGMKRTAWESEKPKKEMLDLDGDDKPISRMSKRKCIYWCKLAGKRLISRVEWPGTRIPIYLVTGRRVYIDGKWTFWSLTRSQKSSQKAYNYARSSQIERIAQAPKMPYLVEEGSIPPQYLPQWQQASSRNWPFLMYKGYDEKTQREMRMPSKSQPMGADPALTQETMLAQDELKSVSGQFNPSIGNTEGNQSGKAIGLLQQQGDVSNFDFYDNLITQIERCGDDLNELIPIYYSGMRQVLIVGKDDSPSIVWINKQDKDEKGNIYHHKVEQGKYKSIVEVGPSYKTKLLESADAMTSLLQSVPIIGQVAPDLIAKALGTAQGWDVTDSLVERIRLFLPPQVQQSINSQGKNQPQIPPNVIAALQQADQEHAQSQQIIQAMGAKLQSLESKEAVEMRKLDIMEYDSKTKRADVLVKAHINGLSAVLDAEQEWQLDKSQKEHEMMMQQQAKQHQAQQAQAVQEAQQQQSGQPASPAGATNPASTAEPPQTSSPAPTV